MKVLFFDTHNFEKVKFCEASLKNPHDLHFVEARLTEKTVGLAQGFECICAFANDCLNENVIKTLALGGTKLIALRSAGYNHVDLKAAQKYSVRVVRVPEYSPYSVAEHAVALILSLNRKIHKAYNRVREGNFSLDGLVGFDLHGKTVGVIGTGKIGKAFVKIMRGFGCEVLTHDLFPDKDFEKKSGCLYSTLEYLLASSDIISLHVPLTPGTRHLINATAFTQMKKGAMLINTGRGALIDTKALISALKSGDLGAAGLDVYEEEENFFFQDLSGQVLNDDVLARLLTFPNVLLTSHQGFLTHEALTNIARTTLLNISAFEEKKELINEVKFIP